MPGVMLVLACAWQTAAAQAPAQVTIRTAIRGEVQAPEAISHGRFKDVAIYRPHGRIEQVVLFLSGDDGWNAGLQALARELSRDGALVAGIDLPALYAQFEQDDAECVFPDGDLENLSRFLQAYLRLPSYRPAILVGFASGAAFVYAMLAQAPRDSFAGAVSLGFRPVIRLRKPLCAAGQLRFTRSAAHPDIALLPARALDAPWIVLQAQGDRACADARHFVAGVRGGKLMIVPEDGHGLSACAVRDECLGRSECGSAPARGPVSGPWGPSLRSALQIIAEHSRAARQVVPDVLNDLPVIEVAAHEPRRGDSPGAAGRGLVRDGLAVILSGDGGWAGIDKEMAAAFAARGMPVVGLDSLRYFWKARTPEGTAQDMDRILSHYLSAWNKRYALLIGYSQGADVLPFILRRLPQQTLGRLNEAVLIGAGRSATFKFHLSDWLGADPQGLPILPELTRPRPIRGGQGPRLLCLYGADEDPQEALCPSLPPGTAQVLKLPGGHHFGGDYRRLVALILDQSLDP